MSKGKGSRRAWMALVSMCVMCIVWSGMCWSPITLFADPIITEWEILRSQFMLVVTIVCLANASISLFFYGTLEEKLGVRKLILTGGTLTTSAMLLFAVAQNTAMLYIAAFLCGLGFSATSTNTTTVVVNSWFKKRIGTLISVVVTCGSVSGIIATAIVASWISSLGWRTAFWILFGFSLVGTFVAFFLFKGKAEDLGEEPMYANEVDTGDVEAAAPADEGGVGFKGMFKTSQFYLLAISYFLMGIVGYAVFGNLPLIASDMGYGNMAGTILSVGLLASAISTILCGAIADKAGSKWMVTLCLACLLVAIVLLRMTNLPPMFLYIIGVLLGICYNICLVPAGVSVLEAFGPNELGKKIGIIVGLSFIGVAVGPTIMALCYDLMGNYNNALLIFMVLAIIITILIFPATKRVKAKT